MFKYVANFKRLTSDFFQLNLEQGEFEEEFG